MVGGGSGVPRRQLLRCILSCQQKQLVDSAGWPVEARGMRGKVGIAPQAHVSLHAKNKDTVIRKTMTLH